MTHYSLELSNLSQYSRAELLTERKRMLALKRKTDYRSTAYRARYTIDKIDAELNTRKINAEKV